jgi:hypothetical protein
MPNSQSIQLKRITVEGAAIVASILLAFWIDAWWEDRQDRHEELVILSSLLDEFQLIEQNLKQLDIYHAAIRDSARKLLAASVGPAQPLSDEEIDRLLADLMWFTSPDWLLTPELSSVVSSGDLAVLSNRQLRRDLGKLPTTLDSIRNLMQKDLDFYINEFMPYLTTNSFLEQIVNADVHRPGFPNIVWPNTDRIELTAQISHRDLLDGREFQNLLSRRIINLGEIQYWSTTNIEDNNAVSANAVETIADMINTLEQELQ